MSEFYKHVIVKIDEITPDPLNPRIHTPDQIAQLAANIKRFGFTNPLLIDDQNKLIAGHGRMLALESLGERQAPAIVVTGLTDQQRMALIIADNKLALNSTWDDELLAAQLSEIAPEFGSILGFTDDELAKLLNIAEPDFEPTSESDQGKLDEMKPRYIVCPHCGTEFDANQI